MLLNASSVKAQETKDRMGVEMRPANRTAKHWNRGIEERRIGRLRSCVRSMVRFFVALALGDGFRFVTRLMPVKGSKTHWCSPWPKSNKMRMSPMPCRRGYTHPAILPTASNSPENPCAAVGSSHKDHSQDRDKHKSCSEVLFRCRSIYPHPHCICGRASAFPPTPDAANPLGSGGIYPVYPCVCPTPP